MNSKACFHLAHYACIIKPMEGYITHGIISPKRCSALSTRSNDFIRMYTECVKSRKQKNGFVSCCEPGKRRVAGVPSFIPGISVPYN